MFIGIYYFYMMDAKKNIVVSFKESILLREKVLDDVALLSSINKLIDTSIQSLKEGGKLIFAGNGGSFSDSLHLSAELIGRFDKKRAPLPALSLGANAAGLTCIANDFGFVDIFARELETLGQEKDLLICLSTSGNSQNILRLAQLAKIKNITTFYLLGKQGGKLTSKKNPANKENIITIPSDNTARIQEMHITIGHILCQAIDEIFA